MQFFIYLCCLAHLLTKISARFWLTTPMTSALRSNDDAARQALNIAKMIDFVNSVYNDGGRSRARSGRYDPMLRRFELPAVQSINIPPSVGVPNDEGTENQLEELEDTARYHVIDNPEVLEEFSNKQKLKNIAKPVTLKPVVSETSAEAKPFSMVENKLKYYRSKSKSTASHDTPNPLDGHEELTTAGHTYRPSFPDDDDDDDKPVTEDIEESGTANEINTPRVEAKTLGGNTEKEPEIKNTDEIEKITQDNKALDKDKARIEEEKAQIGYTKEFGQIKQELPLKAEKNNDAVTVVEEKNGSYTEYVTTKLDHNINEKLSEGNVRPRDEDYKNDGSKQLNNTTDTNSENYRKPRERSWDTNMIMNVPVETLIGRKDKSALRTKQNNNHDHKEQHSIDAHKERNQNRNKHFKHRHEKRHEHRHEERHEHDRKRDKHDDTRWSKKEKDWHKIGKQRYNKDVGYDRMEHEWNKRHQQYDEHDNLDMNDNQWDKNGDFSSRDYDSNKRDDHDLDKRNSDWDKTDGSWKKRDNGWNDRDTDLKKRDKDWNKRDDDWNKRDIDSNKRNNNGSKRESRWIKQDIRPYKDDRNKNDWDRKQNEWDNKYSEVNVVKNRGIHDRYEIVDRERKDGDFNQHSEV